MFPKVLAGKTRLAYIHCKRVGKITIKHECLIHFLVDLAKDALETKLLSKGVLVMPASTFLFRRTASS